MTPDILNKLFIESCFAILKVAGLAFDKNKLSVVLIYQTVILINNDQICTISYGIINRHCFNMHYFYFYFYFNSYVLV